MFQAFYNVSVWDCKKLRKSVGKSVMTVTCNADFCGDSLQCWKSCFLTSWIIADTTVTELFTRSAQMTYEINTAIISVALF